MQSNHSLARPYIVLWGAALLLLFFALGDSNLMRSESRWAEIVREMLASGDWFNPTINGETYFDKPLLSYWFIALCALAGSLNEWTLRLPSAVSALLVLWATVGLGRQLWSAPVGLTAGWLLLVSYGFLAWGRLGEADMENLAFISIAIYWYWQHRDQSRFRDYLPFYLILFIGAHAKGLGAVAVPAVAILPDLLREKRWLKHLNPRQFGALAIGLAVYLLPFLLTAISTSAGISEAIGMVIRENIQRYVDPFDHVEPFYSYLLHVPKLILPWSLLLLFAIPSVSRRWVMLEWPSRWLLLAMLAIFLFFSASGSRRIYYILPILPFTAMLMSIYLHQLSSGQNHWALRSQAGLLALFIMVEICSYFLLPLLEARKGWQLPDELRPLGLVAGLLAALAWYLARRYQRPLAAATAMPVPLIQLMAPAMVLLGAFFLWQQPALDRWRTEKPFAQALRPVAHKLAPQQVGFIIQGRPPLQTMFYADLPFPVQKLEDASAVEDFLNTQTWPKLLIVEDGQNSDLPLILQQRPADMVEERFPWENRKKPKLRAWLFQKHPSRSN